MPDADPISVQDVLDYLRGERPGELPIQASKPRLSQRDLSLASSPHSPRTWGSIVASTSGWTGVAAL